MLILLLLLIYTLPAPAAQDQSPTEFLASVPWERRACWDKAKEGWDTGVTRRVIEANEQYADCLQSLIELMVVFFYPPEAFGPGGIKEHLAKARQEIDALYYPLNTSLASCQPTCGTMWGMLASAEASHFLENLLRDFCERLALEDEALAAVMNKAWKQCWQEPEKCPKAGQL